MSRASDKFSYHDPVVVGAGKHGGENSSSAYLAPVTNTKQSGKDQEHGNTSCKSTANSYVGQFISS